MTLILSGNQLQWEYKTILIRDGWKAVRIWKHGVYQGIQVKPTITGADKPDPCWPRFFSYKQTDTPNISWPPKCDVPDSFRALLLDWYTNKLESTQ